jgi:hypothetical protein
MADTGAADGPESRTTRPTDLVGQPRDEAGQPRDEAGQRLDLTSDPRPAVSRAAFAAQYPSWGWATMSLLVVGLLAGFASLRPLAESINVCAARPGMLVCQTTLHPVVVALPVAGLLAGLTISLVGGRQVARLGRSPLPAALVGWVVFVAGTLAAYLLAWSR